MQKSQECIICPNCDKALRPPFWVCQEEHLVCSHCHQHLNSATGEVEDDSECPGRAFSLPILNKLFKNMVDVCQYNCGFYGKLLDIEKHEESCDQNDKLVKCAMPNCEWFNVLSKLIEHVDENHSNAIKDLATLNNIITVDFKNPVILITEFTKDNPINEIYWLRIGKLNSLHYIMVIHQGHIENSIKRKSIEYSRWEKYSVTLQNDQNIVINSEVIYNSNRDDFIGDDAFFITKGTCLSVTIPAEKYIIQRTNPSQLSSSALRESVMEQLTCFICVETMSSRIYLCVIGHSMCENCVSLLDQCPTCKGPITEARNFSLEQLSSDITEKLNISVKKSDNVCKYDECGFIGEGPVLTCHEEYCRFQKTGCVWCSSRVTYNDMYMHCSSNHSNKIKVNGLEFTNNYWTFMFTIGSECFVLTRPLDDEYFYFSVHHLTPKPESEYFYILMLLNPCSEENTINYNGRCSPCTGDLIKDMDYRRRAGGNSRMLKEQFFDDFFETGLGVTKTLYIYKQNNE